MSTVAKTVCLNPNTGGQMDIDTAVYELFHKAILHTMKGSKPLTYTQIITGIKDYFLQHQQAFSGSIEWYGVAVKNDMEARGEIEAFTEKGKKRNRLKK